MQIVSAPYRCQKLKELGFPQEGCEFYYHRDLLSDEYTLHHIKVAVFDMDCIKADCCAAPTVEEMMVWLKSRLRKHNPIDPPTLEIEFDTDHVHIRTLFTAQIPIFTADTLSNAVADMCVWVLVKEGK